MYKRYCYTTRLRENFGTGGYWSFKGTMACTCDPNWNYEWPVGIEGCDPNGGGDYTNTPEKCVALPDWYW